MSNSSKFVTGIPVDFSESVSFEWIDWDELIGYDPCSMQRDHPKRARKASKFHLKDVSRPHMSRHRRDFQKG